MPLKVKKFQRLLKPTWRSSYQHVVSKRLGKHNTIKWQLGKNWHQLHPNVQRRFNQLPTEKEPIVYEGVMDVVNCSRAGWLFAILTTVIGNPLSPHRG